MDKVQKMLFRIVSSELCEDIDSYKKFVGIKGDEWEKILEIAQRQGLLCLCIDALDRISKSTCVRIPILLDKIALLFTVERNYVIHYEVLRSFLNLMKDNSIDVLLLKGHELSKYYPVPSHRPCGDIDVYLMGDYEKGNDVVRQLGIVIEHEDEKHCSFVFDGVVVENHKTLLAINQYAADRTSEEQIMKSKENLDFQPEGYYTLKPLDNYIFLLRHLARHFGSEEGYNSRQLLDIVLFLSKNKRRIDKHKLRQFLKESRMLKTNDLFLTLGFQLFGIDLSEFVFNGVDERYQQLALLDLIETKDVKHRDKDGMLAKWKELFDIRWKYKVLPESFFERLTLGLKNTIKQSS
jgi:hypothetical protein